MEHQKFEKFLDALLEKTKLGILHWEKTAARDTFLLVLEKSSISLSCSDGWFGSDPDTPVQHFEFNFRNEDGEVVDTVSVSGRNEFKSNLEKSQKLYQLARAKALEIDQILDSIMDQVVLS